MTAGQPKGKITMTPRQIAKTPRQIAKLLNDHHLRHWAGFYPSSGGRAFLARVTKGALVISYDFEKFQPVADGVVFFDHAGRPIATYKAEGRS
jgi:hypothetical protein